MDRDIRTYFLFIGLPAVLITAAGLFALVFGVSGIAKEMKAPDLNQQLERFENRVKKRMAAKLKSYRKDGKADYVWSVGSLPWGTNVSSRTKYGVFKAPDGTAIGWAKYDAATVIGYNVPPFEPIDRTTLYVFVIGVAMVALLFFALSGGGLLLVRAAKRAREDLAIKNSFLDIVSHELNTPLGSIVPLSEALANGGIKDESRRRSAIATINHESVRMARMVSELLTVVRLRNGKLNFVRENFDVRKTIEHAAALVRVRHPDCAVMVESSEPVFALADSDKTEQVVVNLLENACRYAGEDDICVSCSSMDTGCVRIDVSDRGPGFSDEERKRIFERFYQTDSKTSGEGLGLGLNIVSGFALGMGGSVEVSPRDGGGSVFSVMLPAGDETEEDCKDG